MEENSIIKFFIKCAREDNSENFLATISEYTQKHSIDWQGLENPYLLGAFVLFYNKIINLPEIPKEVKKELWLQYISNRARNNEINKLTINLAKKFEGENLDIIFLKGAALLLTIYQKDIAERHLQDMDVLVRPEDRERAGAILVSNGFKKDPRFPFEKELHYASIKGNIMLDLHQTIGPDVTKEQMNDVFRSSKIIYSKNTAIKVLDAEYTIITACLNFIRDSCYRSEYFFPYKKELRDNLYFSPFSFLAEMKKILERYKGEIDWQRFFKIVDSYQEEYKIIASLWTTSRVFNLGLPFADVKIKNIYAKTFIKLSKIISNDQPIKHIILMRNIDMFYEGLKLVKNPLLFIKKLPAIFKRITKR